LERQDTEANAALREAIATLKDQLAENGRLGKKGVDL
jgi:hypothetical protein